MNYNKDTFFITFTDSINDDKVKNFINVITNVINQHHPSQIYILFSSGGGGVNAGITLYNFLRAIPTEIVFHNIGIVGSVAICVFLAGAKRYSSNNAHFLFHGIAWTFSQGASHTRKQLNEFSSSLQQNEKDLADIIIGRTSIDLVEVISLFDQGESKGLDFTLKI